MRYRQHVDQFRTVTGRLGEYRPRLPTTCGSWLLRPQQGSARKRPRGGARRQEALARQSYLPRSHQRDVTRPEAQDPEAVECGHGDEVLRLRVQGQLRRAAAEVDVEGDWLTAVVDGIALIWTAPPLTTVQGDR